VVLVRALIIIRDLWTKQSASVGYRPILVLSYKNMAIDRFLVDLVAAEPYALSQNRLIRIGGSCHEPRLSAYSEKNAALSDAVVNAAKVKVEKLNKLRDSVQILLTGSLASFLSFRHLLFGDSDVKDRRKAANDATEFLMECIVRNKLLIAADSKDETDASPDFVTQCLGFLEIDRDRKPTNLLKRFVDDPNGASFISALCNEVAHCDQSHWGDILLMWLCGKKPLPLCKFVLADGSACQGLAVSHSVQFCDNHRCKFGGGVPCIKPCIHSKTHFCQEHKCAVDNCNSGRLLENQIFCVHHACKQCINFHLVAKRSRDRPPRNVCEDHPMCTFPSCAQFCVANAIYCADHNVLKCHATTKKGNPCKGQPLSRYKPYCRDHLHLARGLDFDAASTDSDSSDDDSDSDSTSTASVVQEQERAFCEALTKKGLPCKGQPLPGSVYCYDHIPPAPSESGSSGDSALKNGAGLVLPVSAQRQNSVDETLDPVEVQGKNTALKINEDSVVDETNSITESTGSGGSVILENPGRSSTVELDEFELEEGENLQHLRDVFEVRGDSDEADTDSDKSDDIPDGRDDDSVSSFYSATPEHKACDPNTWTWTTSLEARWHECHCLMDDLKNRMNEALKLIKRSLLIARNDFQQAKVRAKARVYESKSIIGGTMVGCIARLESIRATRPFAVIVEEASEVLEPLLFSCLTSSTLKLEMIGDHRQLQPSVMSRYDFELCNKINVSMFQRLIEAPQGNAIPSTVLSVQRRMRKNICDLTRSYYVDVVDIEDHSSCGSQVVNQRNARTFPNSVVDVTLSATGGREIPGIGPHIYLWTHDGKQERSRVGVSRINDEEAQRATSIAAYLVACGVPRPSIVVLSPYKGQLLLIRDKMLREKLLSKDPNDEDVCRVSTVDRFQGDEEDIIICSLVVDANSKTAFVKLQNRMVVLLSRARLGLYILANKGFMGNQVPSHWKKTLELLESPGSNDASSESLVDSDVFSEQRSGSELPLCCPIHRNVTTRVSTASDVQLGFCSTSCDAKLTCGHICSLPCHWPKKTHNQRCTMMLESPCQSHPGSITCHQVYSNAAVIPPNTTYEDILLHYRCPSEVSLVLPCSHNISLPCWGNKEIVGGKSPWPTCNKHSPLPYTFAACGHSLPVTCAEFAKFTENPASVQCQFERVFAPPCGHSQRMMCWKSSEYESGAAVYICSETVSEILPRCGHDQKLSCVLARNLLNWAGNSCAEVGQVIEGNDYGPQDHVCRENVALVRSCGHNLTLPCNEAFARATCPTACRERVKTRNPACGHACTMACSDAALFVDSVIPTAIEEYEEGAIPPLVCGVLAALPVCLETVRLRRKCGHIESCTCSQVRKPLSGCQVKVQTQSPLCGHRVDVECRMMRDFQEPFWGAETFVKLCKESRVSISETCLRDLSSLGKATKQALRSCSKSTEFLLECGHATEVKCCSLIPHLSSSTSSLGATKCVLPVRFLLNCGHEVHAECCDVQAYKAGDFAKIACCKPRLQECWNFSVCNNRLQVQCSFNGLAACNADSSWICPSGRHEYMIPLCSRGSPQKCPGCYFEKLEATMRDPDAIPYRDLKFLDTLPPECFKLLDSSHDKQLHCEKALLRQYHEYEAHIQNLWERQLFNFQKVLCFRKLKSVNDSVSSFDPKIFANKGSAHGIVTKLFTSENLLKLAEKENGKLATLLLGYASVVKTMVLQGGLPSNRKAKNAFYQNIFNDQYTSLVYTDKGLESLVLWDPFPIEALVRLSLSSDQLKELGGRLSGLEKPNFAPMVVSFGSLPVGISISDVYKADDGDSDDDSLGNARIEQVRDALQGTRLAGLDLDFDWAGGFSSGGTLSENEECDILDKMQFVNDSAPPFAAINLIKTIGEKHPDFVLQNLLMAAELSLDYVERAGDHLERYISSIRQTDGAVKLHPWSLIVAARVSPESSCKLLSTFVALYPLQEKTLKPLDLESLQRDRPKEDEVTADWHCDMLEQWTRLQRDYPSETKSKAMDDLLKLIGLRKVKEAAFRLWTSALQLRRMDPEARKQNLVTANYTFVGNPGSGTVLVPYHIGCLLLLFQINMHVD
jgi:AAA domain